MDEDIYRLESQLKESTHLGDAEIILRELMTTWKIASSSEVARRTHNSVLFDVYASVNLMMKETHWKALKRKSIEREVISAYLNENIRRS